MSNRRTVIAIVATFAALVAACGSSESADTFPDPQSDTTAPSVDQQSTDLVEQQTVDAVEVAPVDSSDETIFSFTRSEGTSTWPEGYEYERLGVEVGSWPLDARIAAADFVVVVDVLTVSEATVNASIDEWWHVPREDQTVPDIDVSMPVTVRVVEVVKTRSGVEGRSEPLFASSVRVADLPAAPELGDTMLLSVPGGAVELKVPADEWEAYVAEILSYDESDGEERIPTSSDNENPGVITIAREPGLAISEGGRYVLILDGMEIRNLDGSAAFSWRPTFTFELSQLELTVDGLFLDQDDVIDAAAFYAAAGRASTIETYPDVSEYELNRLRLALGLGS